MRTIYPRVCDIGIRHKVGDLLLKIATEYSIHPKTMGFGLRILSISTDLKMAGTKEAVLKIIRNIDLNVLKEARDPYCGGF